MEKEFVSLLSKVEELCSVYVGEDAESEEWGTTCHRLVELDKLCKKIRRDQAKLLERGYRDAAA